MEVFDDTFIPPGLSEVWAVGSSLPTMRVAPAAPGRFHRRDPFVVRSRADIVGGSNTATSVPSIRSAVTAATPEPSRTASD